MPDGRDVVVVYDEYSPARMVRTREYKYIQRTRYGEDEFYDLKADPGEEVNLADEDDSVVKEKIAALRELLEQWFAQYSDQDRNGFHLPVFGEGQIALVGKAGAGAKAFIEKANKHRIG